MKPVRTILAAALALAAAPAFAQATAASNDHPYSQTVFFGDSLTDSGHFRPAPTKLSSPGHLDNSPITRKPKRYCKQSAAGI